MATAKHPQASPGVPKTIGVLNLLIGGLLLLCGLGCLAAPFAPAILKNPEFRLDPQKLDQDVRQMKQNEIAKLKQAESAASTDAEKAEIRKERESWEAQPDQLSDKVDIAALNAALRRFWLFLAAEIITGPILNFLLLVSGIGLILLKNWARVLAVWVAVLKIIRLLALGIFASVFVWPGLIASSEELSRTDIGKTVLKKAMEEQRQKQANPAAAPMNPEELIKALKPSSAIMTFAFYGAGVVYPVIILALLSLSGSRLACAPPIDDNLDVFPTPDSFA